MNFTNDKLISPEKRLYFIVIYLLFYEGHWRPFCRNMGISGEMYKAWLGENQHEAEEIIKSMKARLKKEVQKELGITDEDAIDNETPTVESIKREILIRLRERVTVETDSAKLAVALKALDKYEKDETDKKTKKKKSIYDELKEGGM